MDRRTHKYWEELARDVEIPPEGLSLDAYATLIGISPTQSYVAARYLSRRKIIWLSIRRGHSMIYAAKHRPTRGRPREAASKMPAGIEPRLYELYLGISPAAVSIALSKSRMPAGDFAERPQLRAELRQSIEVEAANLAVSFRKFVNSHAIERSKVRSFLWTVFPAVMAVVVETQPDLREGNAPLEKPMDQASTRIKANLSDEERLLQYIRMAGADGIAAHELRRKTGGKLSRERVEDVGAILEELGLIYTVHNARVSKTGGLARGRKGVCYYIRKFGQPDIGSDGRRLPVVSVIE